MRRALSLLLWLMSTLPLFSAEQHTWTDTTGRTLIGEFVDANTQEITVRLENGQTVRIPRTMLSADDLAYADKALANRPIQVSIDASRGIFSTNPGNLPNLPDQVGYSITLSNLSLYDGKDLRVEYRIYYQPTQALAATPLHIFKAGSEPIDLIVSKAKKTFRTSTVSILRQNITTIGSGRQRTQTTIAAKLDGIWVRVIQNGKIICEYKTSDSLYQAPWPTSEGAAASSNSGN